MTIVTVKGTQFTQKFLFGGDMETAGWNFLVKRIDFREAVKGVTFFIVSHHGHESGFSEALFAAMGKKPYLNIVSIHHNDEHIDPRYSQEAYAVGVELKGERRRMLTTRCDGTIIVGVTDEGKYWVEFEHFADNQGRAFISCVHIVQNVSRCLSSN